MQRRSSVRRRSFTRDFIGQGLAVLPDNYVKLAPTRRFIEAVRKERHFGPHLFLSEDTFRKCPERKGVNPMPGRNLLEGHDMSFLLDSPPVRSVLTAILGPQWYVLDAKLVAAIPYLWLPSYVKQDIKDTKVPNLGCYMKPEYRDITYFHGIDWHQDLIDYPSRESDFVTLYFYPEPVGYEDSPLRVLQGSHLPGATVFPHGVTRISTDVWSYRDSFYVPRILMGPAGSMAIWHGCALHGTVGTTNEGSNRVSVRYVIARHPDVMSGTAMGAANRRIRMAGGRLSLRETRVDLDESGKAKA